MNKKQIQPVPRVVIAGTNSGCGKTTLVCALLKALKNRGLSTGAFKCGPDYIDPMFHSRILGTPGRNLDSFFFDPDTLRFLLARGGSGKQISIIEGVMGYYDGRSFSDTAGSTFDIAKITGSPVILAVNARGAALSVLAEIEGFLHFPAPADSQVKGVVFNQCTPMTYQMLAKAVQERFKGAVETLGYLPVMKDCTLESRHLGLVTAQEVTDLQEKAELLATQAEKSLALDRILALAEKAPEVEYEKRAFSCRKQPVRIAVANDKAFCFYYEDSLQLLRDLGAELVPFSPLSDAQLPEGIQGLYLGGGYPELYAEQLSANVSMRESIRAALEKKLPCIAECGGFMYLTEDISGWPQVGYLKGASFDTGKLQRFGYVTLTAENDNLLCKKGEQIAAHEFHYWDTDHPGDAFRAVKPSGKAWSCVHASGHLYAGFPHFHFYSNPSFAEHFCEACGEYAKTDFNHRS